MITHDLVSYDSLQPKYGTKLFTLVDVHVRIGFVNRYSTMFIGNHLVTSPGSVSSNLSNVALRLVPV